MALCVVTAYLNFILFRYVVHICTIISYSGYFSVRFSVLYYISNFTHSVFSKKVLLQDTDFGFLSLNITSEFLYL